MSTATAASATRVAGMMTFLVNTGVKPVTYPDQQLAEGSRQIGEYVERTVDIEDARPRRNEFTLDAQGFALDDHRSRVTDFFDAAQIREVYYAECEAIVRQATGAEKVVIFDHTYRVEDPDKRKALDLRAPVLTVHNDYTDWSAPKRVRDLLPADEAETRLGRRYEFINVWRPIVGPVETVPLVLCDARTMEQRDLVAADHIYDGGRRGETYRVAYGAGQRWYYFSRMTPEEIVLIKCFDSATDGRARYSAHGAAKLQVPRPAHAMPRESIEVRTIAFL